MAHYGIMTVFPGIFSAGRRRRAQNSEESTAPAAGGPIIFEAGFLPITSRSGFGLMLPTPCIPPRWGGRRVPDGPYVYVEGGVRAIPAPAQTAE